MEKIKAFIQSEQGKDILIVIIVILVGLGSFELGRLSKGGSSSGIKIEYPNVVENQSSNVISSTNIKEDTSRTVLDTKTTTTEKNFFASNRGNKYYPLGCSAGKNIKQENKIFFATREEAERAGYELSSSCR